MCRQQVCDKRTGPRWESWKKSDAETVSANSVPRRYGRLLQWAGRAKRRKVCGRERVCRGYVIKALEEIRGAGRDKRGGGGQDGMARNTSGP